MIQYLIIAMALGIISAVISPVGDKVLPSQKRRELNSYAIRVVISIITFCMALYCFWQVIKLSGITG